MCLFRQLVFYVSRLFSFVLSYILLTQYDYNNNLAFQQSFSALAVLALGAGQFFAVEGCPLPCRRFSRIPGPYPLDISSNPSLVVTAPNVSRPCQMSSGEGKTTPVWEPLFYNGTNLCSFFKKYFPFCFSELGVYFWSVLSFALKAGWNMSSLPFSPKLRV